MHHLTRPVDRLEYITTFLEPLDNSGQRLNRRLLQLTVMAEQNDCLRFCTEGICDRLFRRHGFPVTGRRVPVPILITAGLNLLGQGGHDAFAIVSGHPVGRTAGEADEAGNIPDLLLNDRSIEVAETNARKKELETDPLPGGDSDQSPAPSPADPGAKKPAKKP